VRLIDGKVVEHIHGIVDRPPLRVAVYAIRHIGGGISARIVRDAAVAAPKIAHLKLPRAVIAGEFMNEQDRPPSAAVFVIELHAVICRQVRHRTFPLPLVE